MSKLIDLTGQTFYEWTVIEKGQATPAKKTRWTCRCSCGKIGLVTGYDLKTGRHKSCGHDRKLTIKDIKGQQFGELTVLEYVTGGKWKCKCSCGEIVEVKSYGLTTGHTKSCGHSTNKFKDLTGQVFGEWTVLDYAENHFWRCKCSCGTISNVHSYSLRTGGSKSCGHNRQSSRLEDLTGQKFGDWSPIRYIGDSKWECECSCGEVRVVAAYDLKKGNSRNCGHNRKKPYKDLTGMQFGELTVQKYITKNRYLCKCSCGAEKEIQGNNILAGSTISCGCKSKSIYTEKFIRDAIREYEETHGEKPFTFELAEKLGVTCSYIGQLTRKYSLKDRLNTQFGSRYEKEIYDILMDTDKNIDILIRDRTVLEGNKELDIYIPCKKLAIEFNGDYWHSSDRLGREYHKQKTLECARKGIQLIHIFEHEWTDTNKKNKIIKLIKNKIDSSKLNKVYARSCEVRALGIKQEKQFINEHHIQNYTESKYAYGLYNKESLVSVMTFGTPRFNSNTEWELIRYCVDSSIAIVGGAEKIFKHFIKQHNPESIVSYCDISKFKGEVYTKLGFKSTIKDLTSPNYKWVMADHSEVLTRYQTQKQRLLELGYGVYGDTEDEIMNNLGYIKIYDSGNLRLTWTKNN